MLTAEEARIETKKHVKTTMFIIEDSIEVASKSGLYETRFYSEKSFENEKNKLEELGYNVKEGSNGAVFYTISWDNK
jgi:phosphosulfolactate synthase (CoM biosynthesis protein A)